MQAEELLLYSSWEMSVSLNDDIYQEVINGITRIRRDVP